MSKILAALVCCFYLVVNNCDAWIIQVDAYDEECFFENVENGSTLAYTFQVIEGGFLDVGIRMRDPDGVVLAEESRESSGRMALKTSKDGNYELCFSNRMSTLTIKRIMFDVQVAPPSARGASNADDPAEHNMAVQWMSVNDSVESLGEALHGVHHEQEYILARNRITHRLSERTNRLLSWWAAFHVGVSLAGVALQIVYLKKFFEVRRIV